MVGEAGKLLRALCEPATNISALFLSAYVLEVRFLENHHVFACCLRRALERRRKKNINKARKSATQIITIATIAPTGMLCPFSAAETTVLSGSFPEVGLEPPPTTVLDPPEFLEAVP